MSKQTLVRALIGVCLSAAGLSAQTPSRVDFARDVMPVFRQNCFGCHGPAQQNGGLRLDRKSSVMRDGLRRIVPGSVENSFVYRRLEGNQFGMQMPPTGALRPEQIAVIRRWIEEGAEWPDALANELDLPPLNPKAIALVESLQQGDLAGFLKTAMADPQLLNARGPEGSTPFMYAVLYCDTATLSRLLKKSADPNKTNDAHATALMWAASDLAKTRLLLKHGAQVNARSDEFRTPLMIAAGRSGAAPIVALLLDHGAKPNPNANPAVESSPLIEAATAGDPVTMKLLIDHGAEIRPAMQPALTFAITLRCGACVDLLLTKDADKAAYTGTLADVAVMGDAKSVRLLLDHGADVNTPDPLGRTPLMYAAGSDLLALDVVKLLVERGADVNAVNHHLQAGDTGLTVLDIAKLHGETPIVEFLTKAGAKTTERSSYTPRPARENSIPDAISRSIPLLQRSDSAFSSKAGCLSCHNNSLGEMSVALARKVGVRVDEQITARQVKQNIAFLEKLRDRLHQGFFVNVGDFFGSGIVGYYLIALDGEHYKPDLNTDLAAMYIRMHQSPEGNWKTGLTDNRPPLGADYIGQTVLAMRALQLYAPKMDKAAYEKSIRLAAGWLARVQPNTNEDRTWRLLGLAWANLDKTAIQSATRDLLAIQRSDGGWSDMPSLQSTAYATGKAMVALQTAGLAAGDASYRRGVDFLLRTQQEDGSWYVKTRALAFQPYFDAGFPHEFDQWISAAGTSWATMALAMAAPGPH